MIIMEIILVLMVCDDDVAVRRFDGIGPHATRFSWTDEPNLGVECVLLVTHGDARAAILPSSKIEFELAHVCDALLVYYH